jgi:hypothetical protein
MVIQWIRSLLDKDISNTMDTTLNIPHHQPLREPFLPHFLNESDFCDIRLRRSKTLSAATMITPGRAIPPSRRFWARPKQSLRLPDLRHLPIPRALRPPRKGSSHRSKRYRWSWQTVYNRQFRHSYISRPLISSIMQKSSTRAVPSKCRRHRYPRS